MRCPCRTFSLIQKMRLKILALLIFYGFNFIAVSLKTYSQGELSKKRLISVFCKSSPLSSSYSTAVFIAGFLGAEDRYSLGVKPVNSLNLR